MIRVYTTGCPKCVSLERFMNDNRIQFEKIEDMEEILKVSDASGIKTVPIVEMNDSYLAYNTAIEQLKKQYIGGN